MEKYKYLKTYKCKYAILYVIFNHCHACNLLYTQILTRSAIYQRKFWMMYGFVLAKVKKY